MSNEKKKADNSQDELIKTTTGNIELTESELGRASGGVSQVNKHKGE